MKKIGKFYRHEVLDRCMMMCDILDGQLLGHPAMTEEMTQKINDAITLIYQTGCIAGDDACKKCGRTALVPMQGKNKHKKLVCLNCFNTQKRKSYG